MTVRPATEGLVFTFEPLQLHLQAADLLIVLGPASNRRGLVLSLILPLFFMSQESLALAAYQRYRHVTSACMSSQ